MSSFLARLLRTNSHGPGEQRPHDQLRARSDSFRKYQEGLQALDSANLKKECRSLEGTRSSAVLLTALNSFCDFMGVPREGMRFPPLAHESWTTLGLLDSHNLSEPSIKHVHLLWDAIGTLMESEPQYRNHGQLIRSTIKALLLIAGGGGSAKEVCDQLHRHSYPSMGVLLSEVFPEIYETLPGASHSMEGFAPVVGTHCYTDANWKSLSDYFSQVRAFRDILLRVTDPGILEVISALTMFGFTDDLLARFAKGRPDAPLREAHALNRVLFGMIAHRLDIDDMSIFGVKNAYDQRTRFSGYCCESNHYELTRAHLVRSFETFKQQGFPGLNWGDYVSVFDDLAAVLTLQNPSSDMVMDAILAGTPVVLGTGWGDSKSAHAVGVGILFGYAFITNMGEQPNPKMKPGTYIYKLPDSFNKYALKGPHHRQHLETLIREMFTSESLLDHKTVFSRFPERLNVESCSAFLRAVGQRGGFCAFNSMETALIEAPVMIAFMHRGMPPAQAAYMATNVFRAWKTFDQQCALQLLGDIRTRFTHTYKTGSGVSGFWDKMAAVASEKIAQLDDYLDSRAMAIYSHYSSTEDGYPSVDAFVLDLFEGDYSPGDYVFYNTSRQKWMIVGFDGSSVADVDGRSKTRDISNFDQFGAYVSGEAHWRDSHFKPNDLVMPLGDRPAVLTWHRIKSCSAPSYVGPPLQFQRGISRFMAEAAMKEVDDGYGILRCSGHRLNDRPEVIPLVVTLKAVGRIFHVPVALIPTNFHPRYMRSGSTQRTWMILEPFDDVGILDISDQYEPTNDLAGLVSRYIKHVKVSPPLTRRPPAAVLSLYDVPADVANDGLTGDDSVA